MYRVYLLINAMLSLCSMRCLLVVKFHPRVLMVNLFHARSLVTSNYPWVCNASGMLINACLHVSLSLDMSGCYADGLRLAEEEAAGAFRLAQYGPLNSLSTRVNEVLLRVLA